MQEPWVVVSLMPECLSDGAPGYPGVHCLRSIFTLSRGPRGELSGPCLLSYFKHFKILAAPTEEVSFCLTENRTAGMQVWKLDHLHQNYLTISFKM